MGRRENPCQCWTGPAVLHTGHCCFEDGPGECHKTEGMELFLRSEGIA